MHEASDGATRCIDSNLLISLLLGDPPQQAEATHLLLESALSSGARFLVFPTVVAEVAMTLDRAYKIDRRDIAQELLTLLDHGALTVERGDIVRGALAAFGAHNVPFRDAVLAAEMHAAGCGEVYSWDRHFDRLPGVTRREP